MGKIVADTTEKPGTVSKHSSALYKVNDQKDMA
jgi:hypothetical protein